MVAKQNPSDQTERPEHDILMAADADMMEHVDLALEENPESINSREPLSGLTALHMAAANGSSTLVARLLQQPNVDATILDNLGRTALDMAIDIGHDRCIELLSQHLYPKIFQSVSEEPPLKAVSEDADNDEE